MAKQFLRSELALYVFFGALTTGVNFSIFFFCYDLLKIEANISNILSIMFAIAFAFVVNKFYVFKSKAISLNVLLREAMQFVTVRLLSMLIEFFGFYVLFHMFNIYEYVSKISISIFVVLFNYITSKLIIFKHQ